MLQIVTGTRSLAGEKSSFQANFTCIVVSQFLYLLTVVVVSCKWRRRSGLDRRLRMRITWRVHSRASRLQAVLAIRLGCNGITDETLF